MKKYKLTEAQETAISRLAGVGVEGRWWGRGDEPERIYFDAGRRDAKVYVEFDDPRECEGASLKIRLDDCGQSAKWYTSQTAKLRARFMDAFQALTGVLVVETAERVVTETEAETLAVGTQVDWYSGGHDGESNDERPISGTVLAVRREPAPAGTIGETEQVVVELDAGDGGAPYLLYTWRGVLRYGAGAEVVCKR